MLDIKEEMESFLERKFQNIILRRYSDEKFVNKYSHGTLQGLKEYEEKIVDKFLNNSKNILAAGCGCGREVFALSKKGFDVTGIDVSKEMIKKAREISKKNKINATLYSGDISEVDLEEGKYDAVVMFNCVINQIPSHNKRKKAIENLHKTLKKEGLIIVVSNNFYYPGKNYSYYFEHLGDLFKKIIGKRKGSVYDKIYDAEGNKVYVNLSTPRILKKLLKKFKIISITSDKKIKGDKINKSPLFDELLIFIGKKN